MANEAATLVDRVLPAVPVRQWVLSLPFELRALAAFNPKVLTALSRTFADAVGHWYRRWEQRASIGQDDAARPGAITFVQRFGSSLNLNVHFHTCFLDGVYVRDAAGQLVFRSAPPPDRDDLEGIARLVHQRTLRWLARHGHLDRPSLEERSNEAPLRSPIEACAAIATQRGMTRTLAQDADSSQRAGEGVGLDAEAPTREAGAVEVEGFNLHASVRIAAEDDLGRERLCRYGARPPFSLDRFRILAGGRIAYRIKKVGAGRAKHRVMTPLELLARLAALVPPPRYPLVRYHGVLAPHSAWRREIVPCPPQTALSVGHGTVVVGAKKAARGRSTCADTDSPHGGASRGPPGQTGGASESKSKPAVSRKTDRAFGARAPQSQVPRAGGDIGSDASADVTSLAPNILGVQHWSRLLGGLLYATSQRMRWPQLLQRTFDVDILECPKCHGRIRIVEAIVETDAARRILERLAIPVDAPRLARPRDPTTLEGDEADAA